MNHQCRNCRHYTEGLTDRQRKEWSSTNLGEWATGEKSPGLALPVRRKTAH